jgi:hypothetical protein
MQVRMNHDLVSESNSQCLCPFCPPKLEARGWVQQTVSNWVHLRTTGRSNNRKHVQTIESLEEPIGLNITFLFRPRPLPSAFAVPFPRNHKLAMARLTSSGVKVEASVPEGST